MYILLQLLQYLCYSYLHGDVSSSKLMTGMAWHGYAVIVIARSAGMETTRGCSRMIDDSGLRYQTFIVMRDEPMGSICWDPVLSTAMIC